MLKLTCRVESRGIVGVEQRLDRPLAHELPSDACGDPFAGHVSEFLIHELRRIGAALAYEAGVEPLLRDALELAEKIELRLLAGIAPFRVEQPLGEVEERAWRAACRPVCSRFMSTRLADDSGILRCDRRADQVGAQFKD